MEFFTFVHSDKSDRRHAGVVVVVVVVRGGGGEQGACFLLIDTAVHRCSLLIHTSDCALLIDIAVT